MQRSSLLLLLVVVNPAVLSGADEVREQAELIVIHGDIHTMHPDRPRAQAMAVTGDRIMAVGDTATVLSLKGDSTRVIDAGGRVVVPGFNDAHVHFCNGGRQLSNVELRTAQSPSEMATRLKRFAENLPAGRWIVGGDWDHENWPGAPLPTKGLIDPVTSNRPVFLSRLDGHMGLANSVALRMGGVTKDTTDPPGGFIVRDPVTGEPTGVLKDAAMGLVTRRIPASTFDERLAFARAATDHAASLGVTSVQDMSGGGDVAVFRALRNRGELKTRIYAVAPLGSWQRSAAAGLRAAAGDAWLRQGGLKGFADGSLGSTTAWFFEPYLDSPETCGLPMDEILHDDAIPRWVRHADRHGLQVMIHAIGDRANDRVLSLFEQVAREAGDRDRRHRIEHAQHLRLNDVARFAQAGVIASMQPYHCADDGRWAEKRIGAERARGTYAFRALLDSGAVLAFGSDWNVAPLDPLQGIAAAVTRCTLDGKHPGGWVPEQKIGVDEAVHAYTAGSAYAEFTEHEKGRIAPGMLADFVMLSQDIFSIDPREIGSTRVLLTVAGGRVVYDAEE
jgi:predicted amidohydrolase YtcJ